MINKVRATRLQHQLTQQDLAESLSVSRQTIISIEAGRYVPSTILALKIAAIFSKQVEELFFLEASD